MFSYKNTLILSTVYYNTFIYGSYYKIKIKIKLNKIKNKYKNKYK